LRIQIPRYPHYFWKQDPDPHYCEKLDPDPRYSQNSEAFRGSKNRAADAHNGGLEAQKMEPLRVYRPAVADFHHVDDEQDIDQDPDPHLGDKLDPDPH
jgi:hypothetical protein